MLGTIHELRPDLTVTRGDNRMTAKRTTNSRRSASRAKQKQVAGTPILTSAMIRRAKSIASDKHKSVAFLKRAGILDQQGKLAKEYTT